MLNAVLSKISRDPSGLPPVIEELIQQAKAANYQIVYVACDQIVDDESCVFGDNYISASCCLSAGCYRNHECKKNAAIGLLSAAKQPNGSIVAL